MGPSWRLQRRSAYGALGLDVCGLYSVCITVKGLNPGVISKVG